MVELFDECGLGYVASGFYINSNKFNGFHLHPISEQGVFATF